MYRCNSLDDNTYMVLVDCIGSDFYFDILLFVDYNNIEIAQCIEPISFKF